MHAEDERSNERTPHSAVILAAVPEATCDDEPIVVDWCIISVYEFLGRREAGLCTQGLINREFSSAIGEIEAFLHGLQVGP